jgi:hypothetical protein
MVESFRLVKWIAFSNSVFQQLPKTVLNAQLTTLEMSKVKTVPPKPLVLLVKVIINQM